MGAIDGPSSSQAGFEVSEPGASASMHTDDVASDQAEFTYLYNLMDEDVGSADLPQTADVPRTHGLNNPGSASETPEAATPSMGATSSLRSARGEVGEFGGSADLRRDVNIPTMEGNSSRFGNEAFQVGESGGSTDLPQTADVPNTHGLNNPGSASEAPEAATPSMGATSSLRSARGEVGESGGSADLHQDVNVPTMEGNSSRFGDEAFQVGESGGSTDLPQTADVPNTHGLNNPGSASETPETATPSMGATSSLRSARGEVGESGGSADLHQDVNVLTMEGNSSRFGDEAFQVGESGGSANLPQTENLDSQN